MMNIAALVLLVTVLPVRAQNSSCELALTTPIQLPNVLPTFTASELSASLNAGVRERGADAKAFAVIEAVVDPLAENITAFLQTRTNYPFIFDHNESSELANRTYDDLWQRLQKLREAPGATRGWFGRRTGSPDQLILQIRHLNFTLRILSDDLKRSSEMIDGVTKITGSLVNAGETMQDALADLANRLEDADPELLRRLDELAHDLILQVQIVNNLHVVLLQRVRLDALSQERIRRLVNVLLPLEATMGSTTVDLSPLDPGVARELPAPDAAHAAGLMSVDTAVGFIKRTKTIAEHNRLLHAYFDAAKDILTIDELVQLVALPMGLTKDLIKDSLVVTFAQSQVRRLSHEELVRLGHMVGDDESRAKILVFMGVKSPATNKSKSYDPMEY